MKEKEEEKKLILTALEPTFHKGFGQEGDKC